MQNYVAIAANFASFLTEFIILIERKKGSFPNKDYSIYFNVLNNNKLII